MQIPEKPFVLLLAERHGIAPYMVAACVARGLSATFDVVEFSQVSSKSTTPRPVGIVILWDQESQYCVERLYADVRARFPGILVIWTTLGGVVLTPFSQDPRVLSCDALKRYVASDVIQIVMSLIVSRFWDAVRTRC